MEINTHVGEILSRVRRERPLIHHITNLVVMNDTANVTLHVGALPVMAHAAEEVAEMTGQADALVLNLGTPSPSRIESMLIAGHAAKERGIPIVLDPVGAGATTLRTDASLRLLDELDIAVVRGNAGEIASLSEISDLSGPSGRVKGVESVGDVDDPATLARAMAREFDAVVAITGERDIVSDGRRALGVDNGHRWLGAITGTGGMATTLVAAFAAVEDDHLMATAGGLASLGLAAELAAEEAQGPGSFKVALFDRIYNLTPERLASRARIATLDSASPKGALRLY